MDKETLTWTLVGHSEDREVEDSAYIYIPPGSSNLHIGHSGHDTGSQGYLLEPDTTRPFLCNFTTSGGPGSPDHPVLASAFGLSLQHYLGAICSLRQII